MFLTTTPQALPGACFKCGVGSRSQYVDLGMSMEFHGAMYLCDLCITEMAGLLGFLPPEGVEVLRSKIEELEVKLFEAQTKADGYERAARGLMDAGACPDPVAHLHPDSVARVVATREGSDGSSGEGADDLAGRKGAPAESLHDEGMDELRSDVRSDGDSPGEFSLDLG